MCLSCVLDAGTSEPVARQAAAHAGAVNSNRLDPCQNPPQVAGWAAASCRTACPAWRSLALIRETGAGGGCTLGLRGGAGGGMRTHIPGQTRKGIWLGLKRSADGSRVIREDLAKKRAGPTPEEARQAALEAQARTAEALACHQTAGVVAGAALQHVLAHCAPGTRTSDLCLLGDAFLRAEMARRFPGHVRRPGDALDLSVYSSPAHGPDRTRVTFNDSKADGELAGAAFPTCVAVNNVCGRVAPLPGTRADRTLAKGDLVRVDVSAHVRGFMAAAAHT